ncbi:hypothetical protein AR457_41650 [Streptomyces agglomeratus]|nr:hypothetical protein AR457_41650 [Streptomyces agglomeratus]
MRRLFGSVRARAALGATAVVAVALVAAGLAVLLVLRANLIDQAGLQAEVDARNVASQVAVGRAYGEVEWPDDRPVQIVGEDGRVVAVSEELESIEGTGSPEVRAGHGRAGR